MSSIEREARRDAKEFARAQMFYGEGAGTRRKLISAKVDGKSARSEAYGRAFHQELMRQDMSEHAVKARRERALKDSSHAVNKNVRGLVSGDYRSVNTRVVVVLALGYFVHQTELDKKAYEQGKKVYNKAKEKVVDFKARRRVKKSNIHLITNLK